MYGTNEIGYNRFLERCNDYGKTGYELKAAVETTGNARYFRNQLITSGIEVTVVNTLKFKVINESVKKTDKHDAKTLAEFLEKDMLPESVLCSQTSEDIRRILKTRGILLRSLVSIKNQIHGMLLGYGIETKAGQLQSKKGRQRILCGLEDHKNFGNAAEAVKPLFDTIDQISCEVKKLEKILEGMIKEDEDVALLQTIPAVGLITASTIRAYVDDINRYDSAKKFSAYMGLVPWVQNSNETIRHGHITKHGANELRIAMVQCVLGMVRSKKTTLEYRLMTKYKQMKKHKGSGKSIIATARKMSVIIYMMLKYKKTFDPLQMVQKQKYINMQTAAFNAVMAG